MWKLILTVGACVRRNSYANMSEKQEVPVGLFYSTNVFPAICAEGAKECGNCQRCLLAAIDAKPWSTALARRTQHYGARYDYKSRKLVYDAEPLTSCKAVSTVCTFLNPIFRTITADEKATIGQAINNEYVRKQVITPHTDHKGCFGPVIGTASLGDAMTMIFSRAGYEPYSLRLEPGSVLVLSGEARYEWQHELVAESSSTFRRVSITCRLIK